MSRNRIICKLLCIFIQVDRENLKKIILKKGCYTFGHLHLGNWSNKTKCFNFTIHHQLHLRFHNSLWQSVAIISQVSLSFEPEIIYLKCWNAEHMCCCIIHDGKICGTLCTSFFRSIQMSFTVISDTYFGRVHVETKHFSGKWPPFNTYWYQYDSDLCKKMSLALNLLM